MYWRAGRRVWWPPSDGSVVVMAVADGVRKAAVAVRRRGLWELLKRGGG